MSKKYIVLTLIATVLILYIPYIGKFIGVLYTFFHELGHAVATIFTGGKVSSISLEVDGSGFTESLTSSFILFQLIIGLAGYIFVPLFAWLLTWLWKKDLQKTITISMFIIMSLTTLLFVRNGYGFMWSLIIVLGLFFIIKLKKQGILKWVNLFIINLLIAGSLKGSFGIFMLSILKPKQAGDTTILENATHFPTFFWGAIFLGTNIFVLWKVLKLLFINNQIKKDENNGFGQKEYPTQQR